ncbi:glycosyltransferase [Cellulomonas fimi]|uniref:Glycosyltransferase n=1 Tax=Cellulomonas fimi TaxID=1708 RepID=A0A7Y0QIP6_CELFI|nr:glycosyltransferase [Cellulomonas fimi]NMR20537.1 glycosyltransferase [Cellulomonas fimi]
MSPAPRPTHSLAELRRALWHLRTGGVAQYRTYARRRGIESRPSVAGSVGRDGAVTFAPWPVEGRLPARPALRAGVILDDFSRLALRYEWEQVELKPSSWREVLEADPVDVLFVESAWAGNGGAWRYHLTGPTSPRQALLDLVAFCRGQGIPTVFWNKEDPAHFDDFLETARLFDVVLTSDVERLPAYREVLGHDRVDVLPFAAQPALHNPVRSGAGHQVRDVAFAGMYFAHRHPERREQMDLLLGAAVRAGKRMETGLEIFSRQLGGDDRYQFPQPFAEHVVGSLRYEQMLSAYRAYKVFLNVNTVVDSPSMCARRIFEITASGTPVASTPSAAIDHFFAPSEVVQVSGGDEAEHTIRALVRSAELRDRMVHLAQRRIWSEHTYAHRVDSVLAAAGLDVPAATRRPTVSALVSTNRPEQLDHLLARVGGQVGLPVQLVLLTHGFAPPEAELRARASAHGVEDVVSLAADPSVPLGECLNRLVAAADGELVAKMDDDDLYGPQYLSDQAYALAYSGADLVGKQAHYMRIEAGDATLLRFAEREHRFTDFVMGPTIVTRRDVALAHPFPALDRGEDTGFLSALSGSGATIYSADRFNFVQVRRAGASGGHTWTVSDAALMASGDVQTFGFSSHHVMF